MLFQHERGGHHYSTKLCKCRGYEPELIVTTQYHKHFIPAAYAEALKVIRSLVRPLFHISEREDMFLTLGIHPDHRAAIRVVFRDIIYDVISEVVVIIAMNFKFDQDALVVVFFIHISKIYFSSHDSSFKYRQNLGAAFSVQEIGAYADKLQ